MEVSFMIIISPTELHHFLKSKGVEYLYFSSTVRNTCSMIHSDTLMSLRLLSLNELPMTAIDNSDTYKRCSMWNKIPLYLCNLHGYFNRQNKNGPVNLKISIDFLLKFIQETFLFQKEILLTGKAI